MWWVSALGWAAVGGRPSAAVAAQRQVVGRGRGLVDHDVREGRHQAVVARREQGQHEVHHADVGADADRDHRVEAVAVDPVDHLVVVLAVAAADEARLDAADEAVDAVLAQQRRAAAVLEPGELRHQVLLARAALAVRRVGRLGLARLVGVEEGEDRALLLGEAPGEAVGLARPSASTWASGAGGARLPAPTVQKPLTSSTITSPAVRPASG